MVKGVMALARLMPLASGHSSGIISRAETELRLSGMELEGPASLSPEGSNTRTGKHERI